MARQLPSYETLVRWSVKDVTEWLKEANLSDFKDQFTKQNIDGQRLVNLTELDVNNFLGKSKKKQALLQYVLNIKKPSLTSNKPTWIASQPPARKTSRQEQVEEEEENFYEDEDGGDDDSIYSWGDDFDEDDNDDENDDSDKDNYIAIDDPQNGLTQEELYEEAEERGESCHIAKKNSNPDIVTKLKVALSQFQNSRSTLEDDEDPSQDDYIDPIPLKPSPTLPERRAPMKPPTEDTMPIRNVPLLPGQCPVEPSSRGNRKQSRTIQRPPVQENIPKTSEVKKTGRRPVPVPPELQQELYINETDLGKPPSLPPEQDGYIKFDGQTTEEDFYIEPEEEKPEVPSLPPARNKKSFQSAPLPTDLLERSLPPTPGRKGSIPKDISVRSLPPTPGRKNSTPKAPPEPPKSEDELEALYSYSWYHSNVNREEAERRLREENHNGMFLVRKSLKGGLAHPYTLMLYYQNRIYNFPVRRQPSDGKFALGKENPNKKSDLVFSTVEEMISNFKTVPIILNPQSKTASKTKLSRPLTKI